MNYMEAREYLQNARLNFDKMMAPKMKEALLKAEEALLLQATITYVPPLEAVKDDVEHLEQIKKI